MWVASEPTVKTLHERSHAAHELRSTTNQGGEDLAVAKGYRDPFSNVRAKECDKQFVLAFLVRADSAAGSVDDVTNQVGFVAWDNRLSFVYALRAEGGANA